MLMDGGGLKECVEAAAGKVGTLLAAYLEYGRTDRESAQRGKCRRL